MISVRNLTKVYKIKGKGENTNVVALNNVSIDFPDTGLVFLLGKSGSGKSTLLNTIGGLDTFDSGEIIIKGKSSKDFKQSDFDSYRNTFIGFIFQEYNVLEEFTVGKNLGLALELQGKKADKSEVDALLEQVDLGGYYRRKPNQLSGGQKQRVAIARALIKNPEIIMADEPTGALDSNTGKQVMDTLKKLSKTKLVIIVSHDREFAEIYGDRVIELKDGQIIKDDTKTEVVAVKSNSGVSFIDNKIIHIKKDQKITREDLIRINQMIVGNINKDDTIISLDGKTNTDVKKSAFITNDGNREVFKQTSREDIKQSKHNPNDFKMIKSRLGLKDSFKMGSSSLKHKPIRLIFTILLSFVAFGLFGVVNTMSCFNRADSLYTTIQELDIETVGINKRITYYDDHETFLISDEQVDKLQQENPNYNFDKVFASCEYFYVNSLTSNVSNSHEPSSLKDHNISGIMNIDNSIMQRYNLKLIYGDLPTNDNEVCISSNIFNNIVKDYPDITSFNDLKGKELRVNNLNTNLIIVGVLKDNTNIDKYKNLTEADRYSDDNRNLSEELGRLLKYSLVNMCYVNQSTFESSYDKYLNESYSNNKTRYYCYIKGEEFRGNDRTPNFDSYKNVEQPSYVKVHFKNGKELTELHGNQAIVDKTILINNLHIEESEIEAKVNAGLTIPFGVTYNPEKNHVFELEVVGYFSYSSGSVIVSDDIFDKYCSGYSYVLTQLKGTSSDKKLINNIENLTDGPFFYSIQTTATPILDTFSDIIETLAKVLLWVGVGLAIFAGLMLMNFISVSITYKRREIGILRAIGARRKDVFSIFFAESFIICMINFVLSTIGCAITCSIINSTITSTSGSSLTLMMFGFPQVLLMLGVAIGVAVISTFIPVNKFAKKNPIDSINNR